MGRVKGDHIKRLIKLTVMTLSGFHCINIFVLIFSMSTTNSGDTAGDLLPGDNPIKHFQILIILLRVKKHLNYIHIRQSNSVVKNSSGPVIFVRYNRVNLCTKLTNLT
jgi:hypothetical protein